MDLFNAIYRFCTLIQSTNLYLSIRILKTLILRDITWSCWLAPNIVLFIVNFFIFLLIFLFFLFSLMFHSIWIFGFIVSFLSRIFLKYFQECWFGISSFSCIMKYPYFCICLKDVLCYKLILVKSYLHYGVEILHTTKSGGAQL